MVYAQHSVLLLKVNADKIQEAYATRAQEALCKAPHGHVPGLQLLVCSPIC